MTGRILSEAERRYIANSASAHLPSLPLGMVWSEHDVVALEAAFRERFDEDLPRSETLLAVAAIGYRIALRDLSEPRT